MILDDFEGIVARVLDGEASPEEFAELESHLEESADARSRFVDCVDLHNILGQRFSVPGLDQIFGQSIVPMDCLLARQKRRALRSSVLAAAALFVLLGVVFKLVLVPEPDPMLTFRVAQDSMLNVTHLTTDGEAPEAGVLVEGSRLQLTQGTVELTLATGVVSIVQAPADLTLHNEERLYLGHGTAWFQVPNGAEGFQVQTPDMLVTDLGTEFGVISTDTALDEVHVFKGKVEVLNRNGLKDTDLLGGGTARMAGPAGRFVSVPLRSEDFLKSLPQGLPHVHLGFDSIEGDRLIVDGTHSDVSEITARLVRPDGSSAKPALVEGAHGQALQLTGNGDFVRSDWAGISGNGARTVACWVRMPVEGQSDPAIPIVGWGSHLNNGKWMIHATPSAGEEGRIARISLGNLWYASSGTRLDDGEWHHLVAISYERVLPSGLPDLAVYVDGQRQALSLEGDPQAAERLHELNTIAGAANSEPLLVGVALRHRGKQQKTFRGEIDELYVFEGALLDATIRTLAAGKPMNED